MVHVNSILQVPLSSISNLPLPWSLFVPKHEVLTIWPNVQDLFATIFTEDLLELWPQNRVLVYARNILRYYQK